MFDAKGGVARTWKAPEQAACLTVAPDGRVLVGAPGRVEIYGVAGNRVGGFAVGPGRAAGRRDRGQGVPRHASSSQTRAPGSFRRYDASGAERGLIGNQHKTGSFMLPNRSLDIDVDAAGMVYATDTGRHQVTTWTLDGAAVAAFGKFGQAKPEDFVGCCNPVNLAVAPDGCVVTAEKVAARVKVFGPDRALLAVIGPEHFDPDVHPHPPRGGFERSDRRGDPVRRTITIFGRS